VARQSAQGLQCRVCANVAGNRAFEAREMMFGMRDTFEYFQCDKCGCLQISAVPGDLGRYYRTGYVGFGSPDAASAVRRFLYHHRARFAVTGKGVLGSWLARRYPHVALNAIGRLKPGLQLRILDVGCGRGALLVELGQLGFRDLKGVDPFIEGNIQYPGGVTIQKGTVRDVGGEWDLVMMHHAFEHVPDPAATMQSLAQLLAPGGICLIGTPVAGCHAWRLYGADWAQLDPPRHLFIHSLASMQHLASLAGLVIDSVVYDSTPFQFWASEQYRRGIPLVAPESYARNKSKSIFKKSDLRRFRRDAERLNLEGQGDQATLATFYLKKVLGGAAADSVVPKGHV
jgi:SAM-dependent methyltransferase